MIEDYGLEAIGGSLEEDDSLNDDTFGGGATLTDEGVARAMAQLSEQFLSELPDAGPPGGGGFFGSDLNDASNFFSLEDGGGALEPASAARSSRRRRRPPPRSPPRRRACAARERAAVADGRGAGEAAPLALRAALVL